MIYPSGVNGPHETAERPPTIDKSGFFIWVIQRRSGKFLTGSLHGKSFWSDDIDMAVRMYDPGFAERLGGTLDTPHLSIANFQHLKAKQIMRAK